MGTQGEWRKGRPDLGYFFLEIKLKALNQEDVERRDTVMNPGE